MNGAGSGNVVHLHGEIFKMYGVTSPGRILEIQNDIHVGDTAADGSQLRPHIVWFEEPVPMIEDAALIMSTADIFVLVGTSLQVYPAAGLIDMVGEDVPKYIIDKKIPQLGRYKNVMAIEKNATDGVMELLNILMPSKDISP